MSHRIQSRTVSPAQLLLAIVFLLLTWNTAWSQAPGTIVTILGGDTPGFSGDGGPATLALANNTTDVAIGPSGVIYFVDNANDRIRRIDANGIVTTIAGTGVRGFSGDGGPATLAEIGGPGGIHMDQQGNIYITDFGIRIRKIDVNGTITTIAGSGGTGNSGDGGPATLATFSSDLRDITTDGAGNLYISDAGASRVRRVDLSTGFIYAYPVGLNTPVGLAYDAPRNRLIIGEQNSQLIRSVDLGTQIMTTLAGTGAAGFSGDGGPATQAQMNAPGYVEIDIAGSVFVSDQNNNRIRKVDGTTGIMTTVAGNGVAGNTGDGGPATLAAVDKSGGLAVDSQGNLYLWV